MFPFLPADIPRNDKQRLDSLDAQQTLRLFFDHGAPLFFPPFSPPVLRTPETLAGRIVEAVA
jgi:hypothetical protein